jgi:hypothetical protein
MASSSEFTDRLLCPCCGSADTGVLQPEREYPTILNGIPGPPWHENGTGECKTCGCRFAFEVQDEEVSDAPNS